MVQLPLPKHINETLILELIDPNKDVDGFNSKNVNLFNKNYQTYPPKSPLLSYSKDDIYYFKSCTPLGIVTLLALENICLIEKLVVIVGSGNVGKPLSMMLINYGATVTLCNSKTNCNNLKNIVKKSDIVVVCSGKYDIVDPKWFKKDSVIIDVGIQFINNKLTGELDREKLNKTNVLATLVPGGVGPMTVAMLMTNLILAWHFQNKSN